MGVGGGQGLGWAGGRGPAALLLSRAPSCRRPCTAVSPWQGRLSHAGHACRAALPGSLSLLRRAAPREGPGCIAPASQAVISR